MSEIKPSNHNFKTRSDIINQAVIDCLNEMYLASQPSISWEELMKKTDRDKAYWEQHYLSQDIYNDILDKYINLYKINSSWDEDINLVKKYLTEGGSADHWFPDGVDEHGNKISGYRGYKHISPIIEQFRKLLNNQFDVYNHYDTYTEHVFTELNKIVIDTINNCQNFYNKNREELSFRFNISNASPCSNIQSVKDYWKEKDPAVKIKEMKKVYDEDIDDYKYIYVD